MSKTAKRMFALLALGSLGLAAGCGDENNQNGGTPTGPDLNRTYVQIERLGNPLVSEVTLAKRTHGAHNAVGPGADSLFASELKSFVTGFGRPQGLADLLASVLLPDELLVDTSKPASHAGWLTWVLVDPPAYGGRLLTDDVVDGGLQAIFGTLVSPQNPLPEAYWSDNVPASTQTFNSTFPYLGNANVP